MATADEIRAAAQAAVDAQAANSAAATLSPGTDSAPAADAPTPVQQAAAAEAAQIAQLQDQLAAALQVIADQSAYIAANKPADIPVAKPDAPIRYFSSIPFIKVPIMRAPGYCEAVQFVGGILDTSDPAVISVMDAAIRAGGSGFSKEVKPEVGEDVLQMRADVMNSAAIAQGKMVAAGLPTA